MIGAPEIAKEVVDAFREGFGGDGRSARRNVRSAGSASASQLGTTKNDAEVASLASRLTADVAAAKASMSPGDTVLAGSLQGAKIWLSESKNGVYLVSVTAASSVGAKGSLRSGATPDKVTTCALAYATAALVARIGSAGLAAIAMAFPGGAIIGGVFFSSNSIAYASMIADSYATLVGWIGTFVC